MKEQAALLARIVANPDDDAPRKAYADWLTARGDLRGECMALVLQPKRGKKAAARLDEIYSEASTAIEGDIPAHGGIAMIERGMVESIYIDIPPLARHGERWFKEHPITHVKITANSKRITPALVRALAACAVLPRIRSLQLDLDRVNFTELWSTPRFKALARLELWSIGVTPVPKTLANLALLRAPKLRSIRFYCVENVAAALAALAANKTLPMLDTIEVNPGGDTEDETFTVASLRAKLAPAKPKRR